MKKTLFSIYVWICFGLLFLTFFILISIIFLFTFPFDKYRKIPNLVLSKMAWFMMRVSPGWKMSVEGIDKYDATKPTIFIANHQSFLDIPFIYQLPWRMKWVVKHSMTFIPVMGWLVKLTGHLTINRSSKGALRKLDNLVDPISNLVPVMIFPEGTRSLDGNIKNFKNGAFLLALEHGFVIQPIIIDGAYSALASKSKLFSPVSSFKLRVLERIDPNNFENMDALKSHCRNTLIEAHVELTTS